MSNSPAMSQQEQSMARSRINTISAEVSTAVELVVRDAAALVAKRHRSDAVIAVLRQVRDVHKIDANILGIFPQTTVSAQGHCNGR